MHFLGFSFNLIQGNFEISLVKKSQKLPLGYSPWTLMMNLSKICYISDNQQYEKRCLSSDPYCIESPAMIFNIFSTHFY